MVEKARKRATPVVNRPDDVAEQTWQDWMQLRKSKRAPVTETVLSGARIEAGKAGLPLQRFLEIWCTRGSQGLEASWLRESERRAPASSSTPQSFAKQDREDGMRRWEEMTGREHPDRIATLPRQAGIIIEQAPLELPHEPTD